MYTIWDLESGNAVGDFETQESALAEVRVMVHLYGRAAVVPWALARDGVAVADGDQLIALAEGKVSAGA